MAITQLGLTQVDNEYHRAKEHLKYAEEQLARAKEAVAKMKKCSECKHENLEDPESDIQLETRCKDCGFTWID